MTVTISDRKSLRQALTNTIKRLNGCERLLVCWCVCSLLCVLVGDIARLNVLNLRTVGAVGVHHLLVTLILHLRTTPKPEHTIQLTWTVHRTLHRLRTVAILCGRQ